MTAMRRAALLIVLIGLGPTAAQAQSSQFGVRGLGLPMRPLSPRAIATGGAFAMFDTESSLNPASITPVLQFTSLVVTSQSYRSSTNPFGSASGRDGRFPQIIVAGPIGGTRLAGALSVSGYTDRSFSLGTEDSLTLRGERVAVFDTLSSTGGLTDLRAALGWAIRNDLFVGLAIHGIPGTNRIQNQRSFSDTSYASAIERTELSYLGFGASAGVSFRPVRRLTVAGLFRTDGHLTVERDTTRIAETELPITVGAAVRWQASPRVAMAGSYLRRNWSAADADLKAQGGIGAEDAFEIAGGIEILRDVRSPEHRPWRLGVHYATLPFPIVTGRQAHQYGISAGTGFRFTGGRGGFDVAIEQLWRSDGAGFTERATVFTAGISIRP